MSDKPNLHKKYGMFNEYTLSKDGFIRGILAKTNFGDLYMRFVVHYNEQNYEKTICKRHRYNIDANNRDL